MGLKADWKLFFLASVVLLCKCNKLFQIDQARSSSSKIHDDMHLHIWVNPKIGVPTNHPILIGFSIISHPLWGPTPIFGNTYAYIMICNMLIYFEDIRPPRPLVAVILGKGRN